MLRIIKSSLLALLVFTTGIVATTGLALVVQEPVQILFFYSETCPHCRQESLFLNQLEEQYGDQIQIKSYSVSRKDNVVLWRELAERYGAQESLGQVPMTFVGKDYYVGFDSPEGKIGQGIVASLEEELALLQNQEPSNPPPDNNQSLIVPFLGAIDPSQYSLSALAVILGALDGINVCSLGALIIILALTLELGSRRKILFYGGLFVLTTGVVYGLLIGLWHQLFLLLGEYLGVLKPLIGIIGIGGGLYFLKEFFRLRKVGLVCKTTGASFADKMRERTEKMFRQPNQIVYLILAIVAFAAIITVVEFPCSAAIPVIFAGIAAEQGIRGLAYLSLMGLYLLFYLLDELIIFSIAAWRMKIVLSSSKLTVWITLGESILLVGLGLYYLVGLI